MSDLIVCCVIAGSFVSDLIVCCVIAGTFVSDLIVCCVIPGSFVSDFQKKNQVISHDKQCLLLSSQVSYAADKGTLCGAVCTSVQGSHAVLTS